MLSFARTLAHLFPAREGRQVTGNQNKQQTVPSATPRKQNVWLRQHRHITRSYFTIHQTSFAWWHARHQRLSIITPASTIVTSVSASHHGCFHPDPLWEESNGLIPRVLSLIKTRSGSGTQARGEYYDSIKYLQRSHTNLPRHPEKHENRICLQQRCSVPVTIHPTISPSVSMKKTGNTCLSSHPDWNWKARRLDWTLIPDLAFLMGKNTLENEMSMETENLRPHTTGNSPTQRSITNWYNEIPKPSKAHREISLNTNKPGIIHKQVPSRRRLAEDPSQGPAAVNRRPGTFTLAQDQKVHWSAIMPRQGHLNERLDALIWGATQGRQQRCWWRCSVPLLCSIPAPSPSVPTCDIPCVWYSSCFVGILLAENFNLVGLTMPPKLGNPCRELSRSLAPLQIITTKYTRIFKGVHGSFIFILTRKW